MQKYNIYSGLIGSYGGATYKYTVKCDSKEDAEHLAFLDACCVYEDFEDNLQTMDDVITEYCDENNISNNDLTDQDFDKIHDSYEAYRDLWIEYFAIPVEEDHISQDDLIPGYIDDSTCEVSSES